METTANMALTVWDQETDPYSHVQLTFNFEAIDAHDHSSGKGVQIPSGGIANNAIGAQHVADGALPGSKLADGSIGIAKLDPLLLAAIVPLGVSIPWTRLDPSQTIPAGPGTLFEVPIGQTVTDHDIPGVAGSITLPDWRNRFVFYTDDVAGTGAFGGANNKDLSHSHIVNAHSHVVDGHTHLVSAHAHFVSDHVHGIVSDGSHLHRWTNDLGEHQPLFSRAVGTSGAQLQSLYIVNFNEGGSSNDIDMDSAGAHAHGGFTTGMSNAGSVATTSASPGTSSASPGTSSASPSTNSSLSTSFDIRPSYVTVIPLMRVRNP